ncbi:MAG: hypothetical protein U9N59_10640 [Campylobacterota bacterium]|nr:hypothetical protein [Campylobacterota bacterium]
MKQIYLSLFFILLFIFQGCSSKQYFEPESMEYMNVEIQDINSTIIDYNSDGATLENGQFISKDGISTITLDKNYKFLNSNNNIVTSSDDNGSISINNNKEIKKLKFDKNIVSAAIKNNLIAFGSVDNSINLYDIKSEKIVFRDYLKHSFVNDIKIANPIFLNTVILYPTLDGKIVIVDIKNRKVVKSINFDPRSEINNIIFLKTIGDSLIAATSKKIFSFVDGKTKIVDFDVRNIIIKDKYIYIATLDGNLIKFDEKLNELKRKKFKFAKFTTIGYGKYFYALESQGYLIKLDEDFDKADIFYLYFDDKEKVISIEDKLYFEDEYIVIE